MSESKPGWDNIRVDVFVAIALIIAVVGVVALGVFPTPAMAFAAGGLFR